MKLSPVASSSDLDLAREIARRLHQAASATDAPPLPAAPARRLLRPTPAPTPAPPLTREAPEPPARRAPVAAAAIEPTPVESWPPSPRPVPTRYEPPPIEIEEPDVPQRALSDEEPGTDPSGIEIPLPLEMEPEPAPPSWDEPSPSHASIAADLGAPENALDALTAPDSEESIPDTFAPGVPPIEIEEPDEEPEEVVRQGLESLPDMDPFSGAGGEMPFEIPASLMPTPDEEPSMGGPEEELFDTSPPPPSWGEIIESCMAMAHARGALLADGTGQLVAVRGEWPEPGPEAIATRLVAMMERTLRDAPTRSVSAPVGPLHLTAWRTLVGDRLLTAAFLAEAAVRPDLRPSIDQEIQSGPVA